MKRITIIIWLCCLAVTTAAQTIPVRAGWHSFTIQWISFNKAGAGRVNIRPTGKGQYSIEGRQSDARTNDYVSIKGTFSSKGRALYFNGRIVSRISIINNGAPCERTGPFVFKASGTRKYWRLQEMLNCDNTTTDYIDIFF